MFVIMRTDEHRQEQPVAIRETREEATRYCRALAEDVRDKVKAGIEPFENGCRVQQYEIVFAFVEVTDAPVAKVSAPRPS